MSSHSVAVGAVVATHLLRSLIDWGGGSKLQSELVELRLEVFRARELLSSYNRVLENCENEGSWLRLTNRFVTSLNILLVGGLVLIFLWAFYIRGVGLKREPRVLKQIVDSSEDEVQLVPSRTGPLKPSSFGKGR